MTTCLEYPLSPKYIPQWSIGEAIRELIANALDVDDNPSITWKDGYAMIEDHSAGIQKEFWIIGEGDHGEIGQFGEGLKMAMLVLAREDRDVSVATVDYTVRPSLIHSVTYGAQILALNRTETSRNLGTLIRVECSQEEFKDAYERFLRLRPVKILDRDQGILDAPGDLYINGVYASRQSTLWGYNVTDKSMTNRDRTVLDSVRVHNHLTNIIRNLNQVKLITQLLQAATNQAHHHNNQCAEFDVITSPVYRNHYKWKKAFRIVFGDNACVSVDIHSDRFAADMGYIVVNRSELSSGLIYCLTESSVRSSYDVVKAHSNRKFVWLKTPLTKYEEIVLVEATKLAENIVPLSKVRGVKMVEDFPSDLVSCGKTLGLYKGKTIYLHRDVLQQLSLATGVLIHERLHGLGHVDADRRFEFAMTELLGELAVRI